MRQSIQHKILIYFSAAALLTMLLLGVVVTWQLNRSFSQQAEELTKNLTAQIANNLDYPHQTFSVRLRSDIRSIADDVRQTPGLIADFEGARLPALRGALQHLSSQERLDFAALFDLDGRLQASFPATVDDRKVEETFRRSEFGSLPQRVRQAQTENVEIWESLARLDAPTRHTLRISSNEMPPDGMVWMAAVSLLKNDFDEPIGFCLVGRLLPRYEEILTELYNTGGYASVLYSGDTPVAQAGFGSLGAEAFDLTTLSLPQATTADIMQTRTKTRHTLLLAGQTYLMTCAPLRAHDEASIGSLCIGLLETRISEAQQALIARGESTRRQILTSMTQIGAFSIVVFMLLSLIMAAAIVKPIRHLSQTSQKIAAGDLKQQIPLTSHDEIGELITAFNGMMANLRDKERTVEKQTTELSDANNQLTAVLNHNLELLKQSHRSEQLLRNVLDNSPELIFAKDQQFRYILANTSYVRMLGKTADDVLGKTDLEIGLPKEYIFGNPDAKTRGFRADDAIVLAGEPVHNANDSITDTHGQQRVFETYKLPLRDENGEIFAILGVSHEETEQRRTEQQLRTFHALTEYSIDAIGMVDLDGIFSYANRAAYELYGYNYDQQDMLGMPLATIWAQDSTQVSLAEMIRHTKAGWWRGEVAQQRKDASLFDAYVTTSLLRDDRDRPFAMAISVRDITDRKRADEQLRSVSQYTRSLLESSLDPILTISPVGVITDVNSATEMMIGVSREHLIGSDFAVYFTCPEEAAMLYKQAYLKGSVRDFPLIIRHTSGHVTDVLCHATVYKNAQGVVQGVFVSARDITDRKQAEEQLRQANQRLAEANQLLEDTNQRLGDANQRLEEANQRLAEASQHKSDFLANMSHELRTPLNAIIGFTSMTLAALKDSLPEEHVKNLRKSETAARTLMQVISDVLDLSKIEAGEMQIHLEEIYLEDLLDEIAITTEGLLVNKTIAFACTYPDEMPPIHTDYVKVKQILNNLVSNAVKFTTTGSVTVTASVLNDPSPQWGVQIAVQDTGCGIPEDKLPLIFESFKQVDGSIRKKFGGTGLGLAITKNFCATLGIDLRVQSDAARGTTFWITIPASYQGFSEQPAFQPASSAAAPEFQTESLTIEPKAVMLCLASADLCDTIRHQLDGVPLEIYRVQSVEECLEYADKALIWAILIESDDQDFTQLARLKAHPVLAQIPVILCGQSGNRPDLPPSGPIERLAQPVKGPQLFETLLRLTSTRTGNILIVDDNQMNLDLEASVFRNAGYTVHIANSGEEGIQQAANVLPDIILMDLGMPGLDGFEATQRLKQQGATASITVIACSAFATKGHQQRAREVGCEGYITKPVEPNRLVEQVLAYVLAATIRQRLQQPREG